jgi:glutathione-specific gamma-glutamylcyclotransferase
MPMAVYEPRWLRCRTPEGEVKALAFTLDRTHPSHTGAIADDQMLNILRCAKGRYGTTLEYLIETHRGLQAAGIHDAEVARLVQLARREGLSASAA